MIKRSIQTVLVFSSALALTSCATITTGGHQKLAVKSGRVSGAHCTLKNSKGKWNVNTPGSVSVDRSADDLTVSCSKNGSSKTTIVTAHTGAGYYGNILVGGAIGRMVDASNGSAYSYPDTIDVPLRA